MYGVVYFSSLDWDFRKQDHQFIASAFAERGHPVLFIENTGARFPAPTDLTRVLARLRNWSRGRSESAEPLPAGIELVSPVCIPGAQLAPERALNIALIRTQIGAQLARLSGGPRILWVGLPTWTALDVANSVRPRVLVYYCGDAFTELPGLRRGIAASEREIIRRSDVVFATSRALIEHCRELGADPIAVPVGIDIRASRAARDGNTPEPPELRSLRGRKIGYMGGLNYKVDAALLDAVSARFPNDTLVVLGSVEDPRSAPRPAPNVVILGERPYGRIAEYIACFDVCLVPYRMNEYTASVSPAKLLEYLAVGRPVVSTPLPEVLAFADVVRLADTHEAFLNAIAETLGAPDDPAAREMRQRRADAHSYERLADELIAIVEGKLALDGSARS